MQSVFDQEVETNTPGHFLKFSLVQKNVKENSMKQYNKYICKIIE